MEPLETTHVVSAIVVVAASLFLLGLGAVSILQPAQAKRFLRAFASSAGAHYTEQALRLLVGAAMVNYSPRMWQPDAFRVFGWILVVTALGLILTPWRWHHQFAVRTVPAALRRLKLIAVGSFLLGGLILYSVLRSLPA